MSWDIYVQDIPASVKSAAEIPDAFEPGLLGKRADIIARIREVVPTAEFTPTWGRIEGPDFSIEVSMGDLEDVKSFAFHIRGGDVAAFVVADILVHLGFRAFDPSSAGGIFRLDAPSDGLNSWRVYREMVGKE